MPPAASTQSKRIYLLDESERALLYDRPQFTNEERVGYFTLPPIDVALMETFTDGAVQAFFVLTLGYLGLNARHPEPWQRTFVCLFAKSA